MTGVWRAGKIFVLGALLVGLVAACFPDPTSEPSPQAGPVSANLGETVQLKLGQSATYESEGITVTPIEVLTDSRCPINVNCAWSGELRLMVAVTRGGGPVGTFEITTLDAHRPTSRPTFEGYGLVLTKVAPDRLFSNPPSGDGRANPIKPSDYVFNLVLTATSSEAR